MSSLFVDTGPVDYPFEIRDDRLQVVHVGVADREVQLTEGLYLVTVAAPGREAEETVILGANQHKVLHLEPDTPRRLTPGAEHAPTARDVDMPAIPAWGFRFVRVDHVDRIASADVPEVLNVDYASGTLHMRLGGLAAAVHFLQLVLPGAVPLNVALPCHEDDCIVAVGQLGRSLVAAAEPATQLGAIAAQYLASDEAERGGRFVSAPRAQMMLYRKRNDPIGAAIGGYLLLKAGALDRMHDWPYNLARWFPSLPDGEIVAGEHSARSGDHRMALHHFLRVRRRLPIFTEGLSILISRLRQYETNKVIRASLPEAMLERAQGHLHDLQRWAPFVDFSAQTVTFSAAAVGSPEDSQVEVPIGVGFRIFSLESSRLVIRGAGEPWEPPRHEVLPGTRLDVVGARAAKGQDDDPVEDEVVEDRRGLRVRCTKTVDEGVAIVIDAQARSWAARALRLEVVRAPAGDEQDVRREVFLVLLLPYDAGVAGRIDVHDVGEWIEARVVLPPLDLASLDEKAAAVLERSVMATNVAGEAAWEAVSGGLGPTHPVSRSIRSGLSRRYRIEGTPER
jgi:hypothetical protein